MAKRLVDANVILRYLLRDDEGLYVKSYDFLEKVRTGEEMVEILESVLAECVYVLLKLYAVGRVTIAEKLGGLLAYKGIGNTDRGELLGAVKMFGQTNLSIVDCLLLAKAAKRGIELFTFDKGLINASKKMP